MTAHRVLVVEDDRLTVLTTTGDAVLLSAAGGYLRHGRARIPLACAAVAARSAACGLCVVVRERARAARGHGLAPGVAGADRATVETGTRTSPTPVRRSFPSARNTPYSRALRSSRTCPADRVAEVRRLRRADDSQPKVTEVVRALCLNFDG
jgi:hypothetical protein